MGSRQLMSKIDGQPMQIRHAGDEIYTFSPATKSFPVAIALAWLPSVEGAEQIVFDRARTIMSVAS